MPTVLTISGFRFAIYFDDHEPPHVHVFKSGEECVIDLGQLPNNGTSDEAEAPTLRETYMAKRQSRQALELAYENQEYLLVRWREING